MTGRAARGLGSWVVRSAATIYSDVAARAQLLREAVRRDRAEVAFDDVLAANAEPVTLPEPLVRSKVS